MVYTTDREEIPQIEEEDEDKQKHSSSINNFITHHNMHQESKLIHQKYSAQLQDHDDDQYYDEIDQAHEVQYSLPVTPYDWPARHNNL